MREGNGKTKQYEEEGGAKRKEDQRGKIEREKSCVGTSTEALKQEDGKRKGGWLGLGREEGG